MKSTIKFSIAILLVGILALIAAGVWASPKFQGTVPPVPTSGSGKCPNVIDMGTALFTPLGQVCTFVVDLIVTDTGNVTVPPEGLAYLSSTFKVTIDPVSVLVKACYPYPPDLAEKNAKIYRLNEEANPKVWVEVPGAEVKDGVICVTSSAGIFSLIGNP